MAEPGALFQPPGFRRLSTFTSRGRINYYQSEPGEAQETLVFLHGFGGGSSSFEWSKVYPAFSADFRVLAPDLPGWGFSEHRVQDYTPEDYRAAIREFLEKTCEGKTTVVGSSVVGGLLIWLAVESPELFKGIIAMNPSGLSDFGKPYDGSFFSFVNNVPLVNQFLYERVIANRLLIRNFLETRLFVRKNRVTEEMVEAYYASAQEPEGQYAAYSFLKGDLSFDLAEWLPKLQVPAAILWGAMSEYEPPQTGERLAALSPLVKLFLSIEDTGLTPQLELPAPTIAAIRRALAVLTADHG